MNCRVALFFICFLQIANAGLWDYTVLITKDVVQQKINERLSAPLNLLQYFRLKLTATSVDFVEDSNRIRVGLNSDLTSTLFKERYHGDAQISGVIAYDRVHSAVVLKSPKVESLRVNGLNAQQAALLSDLSKSVGSDLLEGLVLYQVNPNDLNLGGTQYMPKDFKVTSKGLEIVLTPE